MLIPFSVLKVLGCISAYQKICHLKYLAKVMNAINFYNIFENMFRDVL